MAGTPNPSADDAGDPVRWRFNRECRLESRSYGEHVVVCNAASGQTHFLTEIGAEVLQTVRSEDALDSRQICTRVSAALQFDESQDLNQYIADALAVMAGLGLIDPCRP